MTYILPHTLRKKEINLHHSKAICGPGIAWTSNTDFGSISSIYCRPPIIIRLKLFNKYIF